MNAFIACIRKEFLAQRRTGKFFILVGIFFLFGLMNPAIAKLTPYLLDSMSSALASTGLSITTTEATPMDSWVQFFKNLPMAVIAFVLLQSGIFTREYRSGTLILSLTKGLPRYQVVVTKALTLAFTWSVGYCLCFGVTYCGNLIFWKLAPVEGLGLSVFCWWLFGIWIISLMCLFSAVMHSNIGVLLGTGGAIFLSLMLSLIPKAGQYLPTALSGGTALFGENSDVTVPIILTLALTAVFFLLSIRLFNKKEL